MVGDGFRLEVDVSFAKDGALLRSQRHILRFVLFELDILALFIFLFELVQVAPVLRNVASLLLKQLRLHAHAHRYLPLQLVLELASLGGLTHVGKV